MKAVIAPKYGPPEVLKLVELDRPVPKSNEVLIKVKASSINSADWRIMTATPNLIRIMGEGLLSPKRKILGKDVAGVIESVGVNVIDFKVGDHVFGEIPGGAYAEYVAVSENLIAHKPENISFDLAAAIPLAGLTALQGLRDHGHVRYGHNVLINGAGGGVGSFAVQIAKAYGAYVTASTSTGKVEAVKTLEADRTVDYNQVDITQDGERYDLIFDVGAYRPLSDYKNSLTPSGKHLLIGGEISRLFKAMAMKSLPWSKLGKHLDTLTAEPNKGDLEELKKLVEAGKLKPLVDSTYNLAQLPEAFSHYESGKVAGKIIINVSN